MPADYFCDVCGSDDCSGMDWDGEILCTIHSTEKKLRLLRSEYKRQREWVRGTWFAGLVKMRKEIDALEKELRQLHMDTEVASDVDAKDNTTVD